MSKKFANAFTTAGKKTDMSSLIASTKKVDYGSATKKFDPSAASKKVDYNPSSAAKKLDATRASSKLDGLKKLETSDFTKRFGDTVKKSKFYKQNQGKLLALGLTVATISAWYGTLLAQGYSPAEAWDKMTGDIADATQGAGEALLRGVWQAFVVLVHNFAGKHLFDDTEGTEQALKVLLASIVVVRLLGLMGINIFGLIFGLVFRIIFGSRNPK